MKKLVLYMLSLCSILTLSACAGNADAKEAGEMIKITALNGNKEEVEVEVPYNPERIAILDMAALDILDNLGLNERVVGSATTSLDYLQDYVTNKEIVNLGTIKEADLEAVMKSDPDIIFIGGRLSASYEQLSEIAPVVYLATDAQLGLVESVHKNASTIASIFGMQNEVAEKMAGYQARIEKLQEFGKNATAIIGMSTSGSFNILGNDGRCSMISKEIGFENIGATAASSKADKKEEGSATSTHGNEASFELLMKLNPDYLFVLDRDAAIQTEGALLARDIVENELTMKTNAYKNGNILYLAHPDVWYTAEGGITALDIMLQDLEVEILK